MLGSFTLARVQSHFSWEIVAPLLQTEIARLSIFMSLAGYVVLFSDLLFTQGYPTFSNLFQGERDPVSAGVFLLSPIVKWRMVYIGLIFLMFGRLLFSFGCPARLKTHGFSKVDYVQSAQKSVIRSEYDAMFARVGSSPTVAAPGTFGMQKNELYGLLFPDFDVWGKAIYEVNRGIRGQDHNMSADDAKPNQEAALGNFLRDAWASDYELALLESPTPRLLSIFAGGMGYLLLAIPSLDLMQAVLRAIAFGS
ncbi:hypothetical protein [Pseudotabrizicola sp. 4114]|uniref:hypothetical protein n=1 Tax=Pseudotabrizicola sp. 4114 TaxID=2817731 RepID=UPI002866850A|nr:hypothetical protein [Pseudorhodobacter sp. 4114]